MLRYQIRKVKSRRRHNYTSKYRLYKIRLAKANYSPYVLRHSVALKPYVQYLGWSKKSYKKVGAKKLRSYLNQHPNTLLHGKKYRRVYDLCWEVS